MLPLPVRLGGTILLDSPMLGITPLETEFERLSHIIRLRPKDSAAYVRRGMVNFKLAKIYESIRDFDRAEQIDPKLRPRLWQRGLSFYYANRFAEGVAQFEIDLTVNAQDVEETVWRYLCMARLQGVAIAQESLQAVQDDPRPVLRSIYDLYAGNALPEQVLAVGTEEGDRGLFYSHLYVGLWFEAAQNEEQAKAHITTAADQYPIDDYMWRLACVHQKLRGWG